LTDDTFNEFLQEGKCSASVSNKNKNANINEEDLKMDESLMNPKWDRNYDPNQPKCTSWKGPLVDKVNRGVKPLSNYYCPVGWKRCAIKVDDFDNRTNGWSVAYHGSQIAKIGAILSSTIVPSKSGCWAEKNVDRIYFSPSIEYCAHPRYSKPTKFGKKFIQLIFQCRVDPTAITLKPETLLDEGKKNVKIDENFDNSTLEWVMMGDFKRQFVAYGIMIRVSENPLELKSSEWWKSTNLTKTHYPELFQ